MTFKHFRNVRAFLSDYYLGSVFGRGEGRGRKKRLSDRDTDAAYARLRRLREQAEGRAQDAASCRERFLRPLFRDVLGFHVGAGEDGVHGLYAGAEQEAQGSVPLALLGCGGWDEQPDAGGRGARHLVRRLEDALTKWDLAYGFVATGEEIRLLRRPGDGPRGAYLAVDLEGLVEDDDPESFAVACRLFHASAFIPDESGQRALDIIETESRGHAQQVSDDLKRAVFTAAESLVAALIEDAARRGDIEVAGIGDADLRLYRDAALTALYRLLFILYAEARDPRLDEHPIYRTAYSVQGLLDEILRRSPDATSFAENTTGSWARLRALFRIYDEGLPAITPYEHLPPRGGDFFSRTSPEGKLLERARLSDRHVARILVELATAAPRVGVGRERVSFRELDIEQLGAVYEGLLEYEPRIVRSTCIELRVQGRVFVLDPPDVVRLCEQKSLVVRGDRAIVAGTAADALHPEAVVEAEDSDAEEEPAEADDDVAEESDEDESEGEEDAGGEGEAAIKRGTAARLLRRLEPGTFHFVPGAARKGSGSFYTPLPLVRDLVRHALGPLAEGRSAAEIERLRVLDPACGSAHFLVEAMRFLGQELHRAYVREFGHKAPPGFRGAWDDDCKASDSEARAANSEARAWCKRRIAERCLFGVDKNPTAVNLARVALWIESLAGDRPLTYFEHHIRCGNSLLGTWLEALDRPPLPDMAGGKTPKQGDLWSHSVRQLVESAAEARRLIDRAADLGTVEPESIEEQRFKAHQRETAEKLLAGARLLFDLRTASAFVPAIWNEWQVLCGLLADPARLEGYAKERPWWAEFVSVRERERFFHWELEFPEVLLDPERPGFDAVLGNPPWDKVLPTRHEFYARQDVLIRAFKGNDRERRIQELHAANPGLDDEFNAYRLATITTAKLLRRGGDFPLSEARSQNANEDVSKYFVDRAARLCARGGAVGLVVPSVVYNGDGCVGIRRFLLEEAAIERFYGFENRKKLFPIHSSYKFVNLVFRKGRQADGFAAAFMRHDPAELDDPGPKPWMVRITAEEITRLSPETLAFLEYRSPRDQEIVHKMHAGRPTLGGDEPFGWHAAFFRDRNRENIFDMSHNRDLELATDPQTRRLYSPKLVLGEEPDDVAETIRRMRERGFWPVFEGKHIDQFLVGTKPVRWWLSVAQAESKYGKPPRNEPTLVFRETASNTNERTCIAAVLPAGCAAAHTLSGIVPEHTDAAAACVVLNSLCFDYALRFRTAGTHVSFTYIKPMPVPRADVAARLARFETRLAWESHLEHITDDRSLWPDLWEANRAVAEAYDLTPDDLDHILDSFPVFARKRAAFFAYLKERVAEWKAEVAGVLRLPTTEPQPRAEAEEPSPPKTPKKRRAGADRFNQAAVLAFIVHEVGRTDIGRVGHDKLIYFTQEHLGVDLGLTFERKAAGPWDPALKHKVEKLAIDKGWLVVEQAGGRDTATVFRAGPKIDEAMAQARRKLGNQAERLRELCEFFNGLRFGTAGLERWATIHKCWKDLAAAGPVTASALVAEVRSWKPRYDEADVQRAIRGMVSRDMIRLSDARGEEC